MAKHRRVGNDLGWQTSHRRAHSKTLVIGHDQIEDSRTLENVYPGTATHSIDQSAGDLSSSLIAMRVHDAPA